MASSSATAAALVWFRRDLRLHDNPALWAAVRSGRPLICVFIDDPDPEAQLAPGRASRWWLHHSLTALSRSIHQRGGQLVLKRGETAAALTALCEETGATEVYWNRGDSPTRANDDAALAASLATVGVKARGFASGTLFNPATQLNGSGKPYRVFTPYWKACLRAPEPAPALPAPQSLTAFRPVASDALEDWKLRPSKPDWAAGFSKDWQPGEDGARKRLEHFLAGDLADYPDMRDRPDRDGTSGLSPHLAWGEISPRAIWHTVRNHAENGGNFQGAEKFLSELGWRDFAIYLAHHFGSLRENNFNAQFDHFPWRRNPAGLEAWKRGQTGVPIVDAGMRQLWLTGWMHNRVRMITASFLIKHLGVHWREGMAWFEDTLVDADLNVNAASWQWVAGSGADAAPYFRIFNPVTQGERFDPQGAYVHKWVPELSGLAGKAVHAPWTRPARELATAGVTLEETYPQPVIDLKTGRELALESYQDMKANADAAVQPALGG
ncbi:deoxyribodipyrimidine photo-lyase [Maricaulis sp.]|uniref:cryptochrome/photolyase family protein n=1 Tax=Maricaulis sp. TaxID=1486257 RepID=UPI002B272B4A|nr:deoxyribodipyrimidine photo-lyase [Maricaulis sp.]